MNTSKYCGYRRAALAAMMVSILWNADYAAAGDYEWVQPRAYSFGSCSRIGGDSVPGILNKKYYTQYECREAFDPRACYVQAKWYERQLMENNIGNCGAWLQQELTNCQRFVSTEARACGNLAR